MSRHRESRLRNSREILALLRTAVVQFGQTIVMVTHDPRAASCADRALFLADGRIVKDLESPSTDQILETLRALGD